MDVESQPAGQNIAGFEYPDRSQDEILCHVELLIDGGYLDGSILRGRQGQPAKCLVRKLTWNGHEFLASAKNDTVWKRVY